MLLCFFRFCLGHLNDRQIKIAENWKQVTSKQVFDGSFKFFDPPTTKWRPLKFFVKLNGNHILMANFSKLRKYQRFGFIELHNLSKGQLVDRTFKLWKISVYDYGAVKHTNSDFLIFPTFKQLFVKNFMKKLPGFKIYFEST